MLVIIVLLNKDFTYFGSNYTAYVGMYFGTFLQRSTAETETNLLHTEDVPPLGRRTALNDTERLCCLEQILNSHHYQR